MYVLYSTLLHLPPLRFHWVEGCWDRTQDRCDFGIGCQTLCPLGYISSTGYNSSTLCYISSTLGFISSTLSFISSTLGFISLYTLGYISSISYGLYKNSQFEYCQRLTLPRFVQSCFLFRRMVRNGIPRFSVPRNSRNSVGNNPLFRLFRVIFSSAEGSGREFREYASIFGPRNGIPSYFLFRWRVRKGIPWVYFYFWSTERNSELLSLPRKGSERNSEIFCSAE